jgi:hypothetical protein
MSSSPGTPFHPHPLTPLALQGNSIERVRHAGLRFQQASVGSDRGGHGTGGAAPQELQLQEDLEEAMALETTGETRPSLPCLGARRTVV